MISSSHFNDIAKDGDDMSKDLAPPPALAPALAQAEQDLAASLEFLRRQQQGNATSTSGKRSVGSGLYGDDDPSSYKLDDLQRHLSQADLDFSAHYLAQNRGFHNNMESWEFAMRQQQLRLEQQQRQAAYVQDEGRGGEEMGYTRKSERVGSKTGITGGSSSSFSKQQSSSASAEKGGGRTGASTAAKSLQELATSWNGVYSTDKDDDGGAIGNRTSFRWGRQRRKRRQAKESSSLWRRNNLQSRSKSAMQHDRQNVENDNHGSDLHHFEQRRDPNKSHDVVYSHDVFLAETAGWHDMRRPAPAVPGTPTAVLPDAHIFLHPNRSIRSDQSNQVDDCDHSYDEEDVSSRWSGLTNSTAGLRNMQHEMAMVEAAFSNQPQPQGSSFDSSVEHKGNHQAKIKVSQNMKPSDASTTGHMIHSASTEVMLDGIIRETPCQEVISADSYPIGEMERSKYEKHSSELTTLDSGEVRLAMEQATATATGSGTKHPSADTAQLGRACSGNLHNGDDQNEEEISITFSISTTESPPSAVVAAPEEWLRDDHQPPAESSTTVRIELDEALIHSERQVALDTEKDCPGSQEENRQENVNSPQMPGSQPELRHDSQAEKNNEETETPRKSSFLFPILPFLPSRTSDESPPTYRSRPIEHLNDDARNAPNPFSNKNVNPNEKQTYTWFSLSSNPNQPQRKETDEVNESPRSVLDVDQSSKPAAQHLKITHHDPHTLQRTPISKGSLSNVRACKVVDNPEVHPFQHDSVTQMAAQTFGKNDNVIAGKTSAAAAMGASDKITTPVNDQELGKKTSTGPIPTNSLPTNDELQQCEGKSSLEVANLSEADTEQEVTMKPQPRDEELDVHCDRPPLSSQRYAFFGLFG